jgi:hypothetical protein
VIGIHAAIFRRYPDGMAAAAHNPTRRNLLRISIRIPRPLWIGISGSVLLLGATVLGFGLPIYRQNAAKEALRQRGAYIESDYHGPKWLGRRPLGFDGRAEEWEQDRLRKLFYDVKLVRLSNYSNRRGDFEFGDDDARLLQSMPALRRADLSKSNVTDAGLAFLAGLSHLESLDLSRTNISGTGLAHLTHLPALRLLRLDGVDLTDADLVPLTKCKNLKVLCLASNRVTDAGLKQIAGVSTLERLELRYTGDLWVTDAGVEHLKAMKSLRTVYFCTQGITDAGIDGLRRAIPGLKVLDVDDDELYQE